MIGVERLVMDQTEYAPDPRRVAVTMLRTRHEPERRAKPWTNKLSHVQTLVVYDVEV